MTLPILFVSTLALGSATPNLPGDFKAPTAVVNLDEVSLFNDLREFCALGERKIEFSIMHATDSMAWNTHEHCILLFFQLCFWGKACANTLE